MARTLFRQRPAIAKLTAVLAVTGLALTACGGGSQEDSGMDFPVNEDVKLEDSPTFDRIQKRGKIRVGVKEDVPGLGYLDAGTGERTGFEVELARWMAGSLGVEPDDIEYKVVDASAKEQALMNGDVDLMINVFSITDKRKKQVGFVGPYFETGLGLMVKKDNQDIKSTKDLKGKKVCGTTGSTAIQHVEEHFPDTKAVGMDTQAACVNVVMDGTADAMTMDEAILMGLVTQSPDELKVVGEPFTEERYGIGIHRGDTELCEALSKTLSDGEDTWQEIYDETLGESGVEADMPKLDQCD